MAMEITILNGVEVLYQAFQAISAFVKNDTWFSLIKIAEFIGILMTVIVYIKGQDFRVFFYWLVAFVLINTVLLTPKERVIIRDLVNPTIVKTVDNIPLGVAFPLYLSTDIGNTIARTYDMFFSTPDDVKYTHTGLLFGQRLLEESFYIKPSNDKLATNLNNYIQSCVVERNMIKGSNNFEQLMNNKELISTLYAGSPADYVNFNNSLQSCATAGKAIATELKNYAASDGPIKKLMNSLGLKSMNPASLKEYNNKVSNVQQYFMKSSKTASEIYTQNMLVNAYRRSLERYPASLDGSSELIAQASEQSLTKMKLAHHASYQVAGKTLPALHTVLLVLMVGIFPIMAMAMFIREVAWSVVKNYITVLFSLMMWPVLFAVFNSIITTLNAQVMHGEGFTLSNMDKVKENATMIAGMASWLLLSIPFLSFKLVTNLGQNIASAGSYLGNALASSTSADAAATASGNYNWGNMQMNNINGNKVDLNSVYREGMSTIQNKDGSTTTMTNNGQFVHNVDMGMSRLPFKIDALSSISSSLANSASVTERESAQYQQGFRHAMTNAYDNATQLSKHLAHNVDAGEGLSSDTRQALDKTFKELNSYKHNDGTNIQHSTEISNQSSTSINSGASISSPLKSISVSGSINAQNTDARNNSGRLGSNFDVNVGYEGSQSDAYSKVKSLSETEISNIKDQDTRSLVRNLQASLRSADENWNSFVSSQAKEKAISDVATLTQTNSFNVSDDYSQRFANYVYQTLGQDQAVNVLSANPNAQDLKTREALLQEFSQRYTEELIAQHQSRSTETLGKYGSNNNNPMNHQGNYQSNYEQASNKLIQQGYSEGIKENPMSGREHLKQKANEFNQKGQEFSENYSSEKSSHQRRIATEKEHIRNQNKN
ncbi:conjugal transfer protein TraG N-terminal domain-containing protein [Haemophilus pittmaniae]|uniref:conjugal transfer protein TraG N-terminal domain-containing protein n=1 Tax=Haemophilus pittmaniae TaxID=249188 RepID=UPI0028DB232B|nr:conjugal transfer protein TraG N-terminal domain-containing protein [Haemophilus pittmaniae]